MQPSLAPNTTAGGPGWTWPSQANDTPERVSSGPGVRLGSTWQELHPGNPGAHEDPSDKSVCLLLGRTPTPAERTLHCLQLQVASENNVQAFVRSRKGQCPAGATRLAQGRARPALSPVLPCGSFSPALICPFPVPKSGPSPSERKSLQS